MSLRFKLLSGFFVLIIVPLFLLGTVAFFVSQHMIEDKYSELNEVTLKSVASNIDRVIDEVNNLSVAAIANPTVQDVLSEDTADMTQTELRLHTIDTEKALQKILYTYPFVYSVILYDGNGVAYKVGHYNEDTLPYKKLIHHHLYKEIVQKDGLPVWIGPYQYPRLVGNEPVLTQVRMVKDVDSLQNEGILILQTKLNGVGGIFNKFSEDNRFLLTNQKGLIFYDNRHDIQGKAIHDVSHKKISLPSQYQTYKRNFGGKESLVSVYGLSLKNWRILSVRSWHSLSKEMVTIVEWITAITAICVIAALLFIILFVNRTAASIVNVVGSMKQVEDGDLQVRAKEEGSGEIRKLTTGFNSLINRINRLLDEVKTEQERKKKAEMMLLEAQIRPHFLFNTLESINVLAVQNKGRQVSQMIHQLGKILRISMEKEEEIPIRREIEHLKSYIAIQKYRFVDRFDYQIHVPDNLLDFMILKLTLQPLVENAIQHAFDGLDHKGTIEVMATDTGKDIEFTICDNGVGIAHDALTRLQCEGSSEQSDRNGLGLKNVADRLRIQYGQAYGLMICTSEGEGTIIKCVIPKYERGSEHGTD